jgi:cytochrome c-type biogenesis protein CcmE
MKIPSKRPLGVLVGAIVILSGFGYLVSGGISDNLVHFWTPAELLSKGESALDKSIRLGGQVVPGSVKWDAEALDLRFTVQDSAGKPGVIEVHARKAPPQMFREGMGVIVEGRLTRAGIFESSSVMVKHSNEYRAPDEGHDPATLYRAIRDK